LGAAGAPPGVGAPAAPVAWRTRDGAGESDAATTSAVRPRQSLAARLLGVRRAGRWARALHRAPPLSGCRRDPADPRLGRGGSPLGVALSPRADRGERPRLVRCAGTRRATGASHRRIRTLDRGAVQPAPAPAPRPRQR